MLALSALALAVKPPVGSWNGKVNATMGTPPAGTPPQQVAMVKQMLASIKVKLSLKADKTYSITTTAPQGSQTDSGKWSISGSTIKMTSSKGKTTTGSYSADGNKISVTLPPNPQLKGHIDFVRG